MRKIICILLLTALLLSTLAACNAPDDVSADAFETTLADALGIAPTDSSADTTAAPIETTDSVSTDTTAVTDTTAQNATLSVNISSPDEIDLTKIKIDVFEVIPAKLMSDPSPWDGIVHYMPNLDFTDYRPTVIYRFSVYPNENGVCEFETSFGENRTYIQFDFNSFPDQYGIRPIGNDGLASTIDYNIGIEQADTVLFYPNDSFVIEKIHSAKANALLRYYGFRFNASLYNSSGNLLYAKTSLVNGRFDDNFIDSMIAGKELTYTCTVISGSFSYDASGVCDTGAYHGVIWEIRAEYLYYNNYITQEQYDNIVATTPPSEIGTIM